MAPKAGNHPKMGEAMGEFTQCKTMIQIDGLRVEGVGQILRSLPSMSLITGNAFSIVNILARHTKSSPAGSNITYTSDRPLALVLCRERILLHLRDDNADKELVREGFRVLIAEEACGDSKRL